jgi:hypothetical protein
MDEIRVLRKRYGIKEHWGVSNKVVLRMAECEFFNPARPLEAVPDHARRTPLGVDFYREMAQELAERVERDDMIPSHFALGQIIEYHQLADALSVLRDDSQ